MTELHNHMKEKIHQGLLVFVVILGVTIFAGTAGCTSPGTGASMLKSPADIVKIGDILKNPAAFNGTAVVVKGKITNECGSGCWFMIDDGTGILYIDLAPNNFAIPQLQGSNVVIEGNIVISKGDPTLYATKVVADNRAYP